MNFHLALISILTTTYIIVLFKNLLFQKHIVKAKLHVYYIVLPFISIPLGEICSLRPGQTNIGCLCFNLEL